MNIKDFKERARERNLGKGKNKMGLIKDFLYYREYVKDLSYGTYPVNDYLNNAIRHLLKDENPNTKAIEEIWHAIKRSNGLVFPDVLKDLHKRGMYFCGNEEDKDEYDKRKEGTD